MTNNVDALIKAFEALVKKSGLVSSPDLDVIFWEPGIQAAARWQNGQLSVGLSLGVINDVPIREATAIMAHELGHIVCGHVFNPHDTLEESKEREFAADAFAARITGDPGGMISALQMTAASNGREENEWSDHPSYASRIARLQRYAEELERHV